MSLTTLTGDPLLTDAQTLAFGYNARGRSEVGAFETRLVYQYPAAFATYNKQCRQGKIRPGGLWVWRESKPHLAFLVVRESSVGMTRARFVEAVALTLARDYRLEGITSLAIAPTGTSGEWPLLMHIFARWLGASALPVTLYERYEPGVKGETQNQAGEL
jgi:hypothetical protein